MHLWMCAYYTSAWWKLCCNVVTNSSRKLLYAHNTMSRENGIQVLQKIQSQLWPLCKFLFITYTSTCQGTPQLVQYRAFSKGRDFRRFNLSSFITFCDFQFFQNKCCFIKEKWVFKMLHQSLQTTAHTVYPVKHVSGKVS